AEADEAIAISPAPKIVLMILFFTTFSMECKAEKILQKNKALLFDLVIRTSSINAILMPVLCDEAF
ncbi:hypothetical protein, partial [Parasutterella sp.]|uniref:hypothetical protein n=1 Tax=Parasutterella sp. TaxID=2049037 RepID=UPI0030784761